MQAASVYPEGKFRTHDLQKGPLADQRRSAPKSYDQKTQPVVFTLGAGSILSDLIKHTSELSGCIVEEYESLDDVDDYEQVAPSCIIADLSVLTCETSLLVSFMKRHHASMVIVDGRGEVFMTMGATGRDAEGFFAEFDGGGLVDAVHKAINRSVSSFHSRELLRSLQGRYQSLSRREQQVMLLVAKGLMNKQVAHKLSISEITVKAHRGKMMRKMGVRSLAELVRMADDLGVTSRESGERNVG
jgi:FixJ family two-component response regulator